ncbi:MAG: DUF924 family protein [Gammaproteobacteria bacterium]
MIGPHDVLDFWFGAGQDAASVDRDKRALWWSGNDAADATIRERFGMLLPSLARKELDNWSTTARGRLVALKDSLHGILKASARDAMIAIHE